MHIGSSSKTWMYLYPAPLLYQLDTHSSPPSKYLHGICNRQFKGHMSKIEHIFSIVTILRVFPISESNNSIPPRPPRPKPSGYDRIFLPVTWRNPVFCLQNVSNYVPLHILLYFNVRYRYFLYKLLYTMNAVIFNYLFLTEFLEFGRCLIHSQHLIHVCWMNDE